jgi:hypothetical protein
VAHCGNLLQSLGVSGPTFKNPPGTGPYTQTLKSTNNKNLFFKYLNQANDRLIILYHTLSSVYAMQQIRPVFQSDKKQKAGAMNRPGQVVF